ncbi:MAG TPA: hypothetical protein VGR43_07565 [Dehalococcoidia bacterium]|jgi:hypothetical protein|nr:hypothetical protein [Dehalococcoidia bacterium]
MCLAGASRAGAGLLAAITDADLRAYYVWVSMLPSDDKAAALAAARRFAEPRATHYWDGDRYLARHLAKAIRIDSRDPAALGDVPEFAWDVYLAYQRGNGDIERPDFWMHQLAVDHAPRFDTGEWQRRMSEMLGEGDV